MKKNRLRWMLVAILGAQLQWGTGVWGQPPQDGPTGNFGPGPNGPGPGFGGPGFGGPGGSGFRPPGMGFGGPGSIQPLVAIVQLPEVVTELKLSDAQKGAIEELQQTAMEASRERMSQWNPQEIFDLDESARTVRFNEMRTEMDKLNAEFDAKLKDVLQADQWKRLDQLAVQRQGLGALVRSEIATALKLTGEQTKQVKAWQAPFAPQLGDGEFPDFEKLQRERAELEKQIVDSMSSEQKAAWDELRGPAFTFTSQPPMGRGPMGGPGGLGGRDKELVAKYDKNDDGWLNREERTAARQEATQGGGGGFGGPPRGMNGGSRGPRGGRPNEAGQIGQGGAGQRGDGGPGGFGDPGRGPGGPGGFGGGPPGMGSREPGKPGVKVQPSEVQVFGDEDLYDTSVVRTLFLTFQEDDWEQELADFKSSDVEVDATLLVDGRTYEKVGVSFRGMSSFGMIPSGSKRSFNISMDMADEDQRLLGYKTLNLLNSNGDPTLMHSVLYSAIARKYLPTPKVNEVRVVVNGEDWGIYQNAQQFDKIFVKEEFGSFKGARWKVSGSPGGGGSLRYLGDNLSAYKRLYEIKSSDNEESWNALINLCQVLNETPVDQLAEKIEPILDVDGALRFLALDVALINEDGYWVRGSDYSIFQDEKGKFHVIPHDMNETFMPVMGGPGMGGPGMGRGMGGRGGFPGGPPEGPGGAFGPGGPPPGGFPPNGFPPSDFAPEGFGPGGPPPGPAVDRAEGVSGAENEPERSTGDRGRQPQGVGRRMPPQNAYGLDPLIAIDNPDRPLRSKLLQVPAYRDKYLQYVAQIAREDLDWENLGPMVEKIRTSIEPFVKLDSRKLSTTDAFLQTTSADSQKGPQNNSRHLRQFAELRREFLLQHAEIKKLPKQ
jgi:hypothetical protein